MKNSRGNQMAFDYAIYMIVGSYFKKAVNNTAWQEKKLLLNYKEQKNDFQVELERIAIQYVKKVLYKNLKRRIWNQEVSVSLISSEMSPQTLIRFMNDKFILDIISEYRGKKKLKIKYIFIDRADEIK